MTSLPIFLRASTKIIEIDLTQRIDVILSTTVAVVGEFERGPVVPTYQSGLVEQFKKLYGKIANPRISFAHDTVTTAMNQTGNVLVNRVTKNAAYAGVSVLADRANKRLIYSTFPTDIQSGYVDEGLSTVKMLSVVGPFVATNTFTMNITDGVTVTPVGPITYATSHNATMNTIKAAIQTVLDSFAAGGSVEFEGEATAQTNLTTMIIRFPKTASLELTGVVSGGTTPPVVTIDDDARLFDVFAENPGKWANNYAIKLSNVDVGVRERYRLNLSAALVTANSAKIVLNGEEIVTAFTTNSDLTLAAIATAIEARPEVDSATVESVPGGTSNDRTILVIAKKPGVDTLVWGTNVVTGGASQPSIFPVKVMTGVDSDNTFTFGVYERSNLNQPVETFNVSLLTQQDRMGYQRNIQHVVNRASTKSYNIRVLQSEASNFGDVGIYDETTGDPLAIPGTVAWLTGGTDGVTATSAEVRAGWDALSDRVQWPVSVLLNAGYTSVAVQKTMVALAEKRSDCIAVLDAPSDRQGAQELRDYRLNELDIDSSYAAMYAPDVEIEDVDTGERRFIPPSGPIGATYAYSDRLTNFVGAPAGLNRGKVTVATGLRWKYTNEEQELLNPMGINCIIDKPKIGPVVMAEETLQSKKSVLSSVHARRILNYIKTGLVDGLDYVLFDPNTEYTRFQARQIGETILAPMKSGDGNGGLYDFTIKCDADNNTPDVIDADQLAYDVYLKIVRVVKGIFVRAVLTRTGANFSEVIEGLA